MTKKVEIELVLDHTCVLGESPLWDVRTQAICWVDIEKGEIHQFTPKSQKHRMYPMHQMVGSVAISRKGDFVTAMKKGFGIVNRETGAIKMIASPEAHLPNNRFNEGKGDPGGRFWAGTMSLSEDAHAGSVYMLKKDHSFEKKIENVTISNGMAWSLDHRTFYYIDTPTLEVVSYRYDKSTGAISNKETVVKIPAGEGYPDGMTIDQEGMLWVAHWDGWRITRWDPSSGKQIHRIDMPVARVTSCMFGGENFTDLYITSASRDLTPEDLKSQPKAGCLFIIRDCGFKGLSTFEVDI